MVVRRLLVLGSNTAYFWAMMAPVDSMSFAPLTTAAESRKVAGFLEDPSAVDVSIRFLEIPGAGLFLELMEYHSPHGARRIPSHQTNDLGGPRHLCLRVGDIDAAFEHVLSTPGAEPINPSPSYRPQCIDAINPGDFRFFDSKQESDPEAKREVCRVIGGIRFFYLVDPYGIQWELEAGHTDIGG